MGISLFGHFYPPSAFYFNGGGGTSIRLGDNLSLKCGIAPLTSGVKMYSRGSVESLRGNSFLLAARFMILEDTNIAEYAVNVVL